MTGVSAILIDLFLIFTAAKLAGLLFARLNQPPVIGELLVGVLIGPHALGLIGTPNEALVTLFHDPVAAEEALNVVFEVIAELGVIVLLFFVGLETRLRDLLRVGVRAGVVGSLGIVLPFIGGYGVMTLLGHPSIVAAFTGTVLVATSVGITARVLQDLGVLSSVEARVILGAAVIDDILAMILIAIVGGLERGEISALEIAALALQAVGFVVFVVLLGTRLTQRFSLHLNELPISNAPFAAAIVAMLGLAAVAGILGLAAIIGAFIAGMVFAEAREHYDLEHQTLPVYEFLVPYFFVITGSRVDPALFLDPTVITVAALITLVAIVGKVVGCGIGGLGLGPRAMAIVGVGMVPRGEVGLIVASLGATRGVVASDIFSMIVVMAVLTTLITPPALALLYRSYPQRPLPTEAAEAGGPQQIGRLPEL